MTDIVFISGPISNDPDYMRKFAEAEEKLKAMGNYVLNPAKICATIEPVDMLDHDGYMDLTLAMLRHSNRVYVLPGWEDSVGCNEEIKEAKRRNMPITYSENRSAAINFNSCGGYSYDLNVDYPDRIVQQLHARYGEVDVLESDWHKALIRKHNSSEGICSSFTTEDGEWVYKEGRWYLYANNTQYKLVLCENKVSSEA